MELVSMTKDELLRLLKAAKDESETNWLMIATTFWHGLRVSEVVGDKNHEGLTGKNVKDGYLYVKRLKNSESTNQPLIEHPEPLLNYKNALISQARMFPNAPLFSGITRYDFYHLMKRYGQKAGIPSFKCKPHALKHTCAMLMLGPERNNIEKVRAHLGHKNLNSTGYYLKITPEEAAKSFADKMGGSI